MDIYTEVYVTHIYIFREYICFIYILLSWFNPSQQLSTMQLLPHSPPPLPVGWGGELGKKVKLMR